MAHVPLIFILLAAYTKSIADISFAAPAIISEVRPRPMRFRSSPEVLWSRMRSRSSPTVHDLISP